MCVYELRVPDKYLGFNRQMAEMYKLHGDVEDHLHAGTHARTHTGSHTRVYMAEGAGLPLNNFMRRHIQAHTYTHAHMHARTHTHSRARVGGVGGLQLPPAACLMPSTGCLCCCLHHNPNPNPNPNQDFVIGPSWLLIS